MGDRGVAFGPAPPQTTSTEASGVVGGLRFENPVLEW